MGLVLSTTNGISSAVHSQRTSEWVQWQQCRLQMMLMHGPLSLKAGCRVVRLLAAQRLAEAALEGRAITLRRHTEIKLLAWAGQL